MNIRCKDQSNSTYDWDYNTTRNEGCCLCNTFTAIVKIVFVAVVIYTLIKVCS